MPDTATVELLLKSADQNHGISLTPLQVRSIATFLVWLDSAAGNATRLADSTNNMLAAYMNEFGSELMDILIADAQEENIVEGVIVDNSNSASSEAVETIDGVGSLDDLARAVGFETSKGGKVDDESKEAEGSSDETARMVAQDEGYDGTSIS